MPPTARQTLKSPWICKTHQQCNWRCHVRKIRVMEWHAEADRGIFSLSLKGCFYWISFIIAPKIYIAGKGKRYKWYLGERYCSAAASQPRTGRYNIGLVPTSCIHGPSLQCCWHPCKGLSYRWQGSREKMAQEARASLSWITNLEAIEVGS